MIQVHLTAQTADIMSWSDAYKMHHGDVYGDIIDRLGKASGLDSIQ